MPTSDEQLVKFICPYCKKKTTFRFYQALYDCFDVTYIDDDNIPYVGLRAVDDPASRRIANHTDSFYQCNNCHAIWEKLSYLIYELKQNPDNKL